jgi:hypothetical protein
MVATINGTVTLIILLIAPLGLLAVIVNTFLVAMSTFIVCYLSDGIVLWLSYSRPYQSLDRRSEKLFRQPGNLKLKKKDDELGDY